eukprot:5374599-Pyramimonas_sp.AAC.1
MSNDVSNCRMLGDHDDSQKLGSSHGYLLASSSVDAVAIIANSHDDDVPKEKGFTSFLGPAVLVAGIAVDVPSL